MLNRAMYGKRDVAQCFDLWCERTMEKLDYHSARNNFKRFRGLFGVN